MDSKQFEQAFLKAFENESSVKIKCVVPITANEVMVFIKNTITGKKRVTEWLDAQHVKFFHVREMKRRMDNELVIEISVILS